MIRTVNVLTSYANKPVKIHNPSSTIIRQIYSLEECLRFAQRTGIARHLSDIYRIQAEQNERAP